MPNLIVISSIISLYLYGFICKGWVWEISEESSVKEESVQFVTSSQESNLWKGHLWNTWLEVEESCQLVISRVFHRMALLAKHLRTWQSSVTLQLPIMCSTCGFFYRLLLTSFALASRKLHWFIFEAWFFTDLSHSSLTNKPTYIQGNDWRNYNQI